MKKLLSILFAAVLLVPCVFLLSACGGDKEQERVMNVELNPKVEFVLDKNDKVVTVNALNDEGNRIISIATDADTVFENLEAEDAVELFLKISKENGYLVSSSEDELKVSISGDSDKLKDSIESAVKDYLKNAGITLKVEIGEINVEAIKAKVAECMQEYTENDLKNMSEEQLINLLKTSRQETKEMLTQELKDMYYQLRAVEINEAKFDALIDNIKNNPLLTQYATIIEEQLGDMQSYIDTLKTKYEEQFLAQESVYNQKMQEFIEEKQQLLDARLEGVKTEAEIAAQEQIIAQKQQALETAKTAAETAINSVMQSINVTMRLINQQLVLVNQIFGEQANTIMNTAINQAKASFKDSFCDEFDAYVGNENSYWKDNA